MNKKDIDELLNYLGTDLSIWFGDEHRLKCDKHTNTLQNLIAENEQLKTQRDKVQLAFEKQLDITNELEVKYTTVSSNLVLIQAKCERLKEVLRKSNKCLSDWFVKGGAKNTDILIKVNYKVLSDE